MHLQGVCHNGSDIDGPSISSVHTLICYPSLVGTGIFVDWRGLPNACHAESLTATAVERCPMSKRILSLYPTSHALSLSLAAASDAGQRQALPLAAPAELGSCTSCHNSLRLIWCCAI